MATTTVNVHAAVRDVCPRAARPIGELAALFLRALGHGFVKAAEHQGSRRAAQELHSLARGFEGSQPRMAAELRAAAERCAVLPNERR